MGKNGLTSAQIILRSNSGNVTPLSNNPLPPWHDVFKIDTSLFMGITCFCKWGGGSIKRHIFLEMDSFDGDW
jgi:hypothetical protein